jgi:glutathione synthase/RimK-type ligase-like ATP-grasp enzyme
MRRQEMETLFVHMGFELIVTLPEKDEKRTYILRDLNRKGIVILSPEALAQLAEDLNTLMQAKDTETELPV